jgi:23S rRNA (adenine2030-N6)-methyltransferase
MNYRHGFHAGNFADVVKHAVLVLLVDSLREKPQPFCVIDTHAGAGSYDLGGEAARTGEFRHGIMRLLDRDDAPAPLRRYLDLVRAANGGGPLLRYPGSPALARALLRPQDRLVLNELEPVAATALRARFRGDPQTAIHRRDGYEALGALLPPEPRRGLLVVDPPFEVAGEFDRLARAAATATRRWPEGRLLLWYALKDRAAAAGFHRALEALGVPGWMVELQVAGGPEGLGACGLALLNPPWRFDETLRTILPWLAETLARDGSASCSLRAIADSSDKSHG